MAQNFLIVIFWLNSIMCVAQINDDTILVWSQNRELIWKNFKYRKLCSEKSQALSYVNIDVNGYMDNALPNFIVMATFHTKKSWTNDTTSDRLLKHEILHFDITEVYARRIRKRVSELRNDNENDINTYSKVIDGFLEQCEKTQSTYDNETSHGVYINAQEKWQFEIRKELLSLDEYSLEIDP